MDPYKVLGIAPGATDEEIKRAYRNLSRKYHPDANVNNPDRAQAEEKFKEVQMAYDQIMKLKQQGLQLWKRLQAAVAAYGYGVLAMAEPMVLWKQRLRQQCFQGDR